MEKKDICLRFSEYLKSNTELLLHSKLHVSLESSGCTRSAELALLAGLKTPGMLLGAQS